MRIDPRCRNPQPTWSTRCPKTTSPTSYMNWRRSVILDESPERLRKPAGFRRSPLRIDWRTLFARRSRGDRSPGEDRPRHPDFLALRMAVNREVENLAACWSRRRGSDGHRADDSRSSASTRRKTGWSSRRFGRRSRPGYCDRHSKPLTPADDELAAQPPVPIRQAARRREDVERSLVQRGLSL